MAGEISNSYGSNPYGYNPYSTTNDDFLAQQYFAQLAQQKQGEPVFQGYQQPQADTFQKSGGIGWGTGLTLGSVAGLGTSAGMYFLGSNPIQDGKVADEILNAVEANNLEQTTIDKIKKLAAQRKQEILKKSGVPDGISLKTLKAYAKSGMPSAFPQLNGILTQEQAKKIYKAAKKQIKAINPEDIAKEAAKLANEETLKYKQGKLTGLKQQKAKLEALKDDADLEKFFKDNAKIFDIEGDEKTIETEAKKLAAKYKNKAGAIADYTTQITNQQNIVNSTRDALNGKVSAYYDDAAKALKKDTPEAISKAFKNFKWNKALKGGGIAGAAGLILGLIFGNK